MSFLKSINRYLERNQAASIALIEELDKSSIIDLDDFSDELWKSIATSTNEPYLIEILDDEKTPLSFVVKILVKIGFSCEDSVRLMFKIHKQGSVVLATAEEHQLIRLQEYIDIQAKKQGVQLASRILKI